MEHYADRRAYERAEQQFLDPDFDMIYGYGIPPRCDDEEEFFGDYQGRY